jgi:hypothetical protein
MITLSRIVQMAAWSRRVFLCTVARRSHVILTLCSLYCTSRSRVIIFLRSDHVVSFNSVYLCSVITWPRCSMPLWRLIAFRLRPYVFYIGWSTITFQCALCSVWWPPDHTVLYFPTGWPPNSGVCIQQRRTHHDHPRWPDSTWGDVPCVCTVLPSHWPLPVSQFAVTAHSAALSRHPGTLAVSIKLYFYYHEYTNESNVNIKLVRKCMHTLAGLERCTLRSTLKFRWCSSRHIASCDVSRFLCC